MPSYKSHALAVAVAGDALNGGVPTQLVHLILGEFQFVEIVVALERTELIAQFDDLLGNLKGNRAGPGQLLGGGAVQLKTFFHSCRLGSALNALEGITAQNEKANKAAHTKDISFFMMKLRRIMSQCRCLLKGR